jgi:chemotaxis protein MotB
MKRRRRSDRHGGAEEHPNHERWLISYADFITLLFAFFVVMYAISSVNEGRYRVLSNALSTAFGSFQHDPSASPIVPIIPGAGRAAPIPRPLRRDESDITPEQKQRIKHMQDVAERISKVLANQVNQGQVRVTNGARGVAIEINAAVLFAPGQAVLQPSSLDVLKTVAAVIATFDDPIQVEGHTDSQPINTPQFPSNWELSTARAGSVVRFFIDHGVPAARLSAAGYAEFHPVESNDSLEGRSRNRRVTLMVLAPDQRSETVEHVGTALSAQHDEAAGNAAQAPATTPAGTAVDAGSAAAPGKTELPRSAP